MRLNPELETLNPKQTLAYRQANVVVRRGGLNLPYGASFGVFEHCLVFRI